MTLLLLTGSAKAVDPDAPAEPDVGALEGVPAAPLLRRGQEEGGAQRAGLQGGQREREEGVLPTGDHFWGRFNIPNIISQL